MSKLPDKGHFGKTRNKKQNTIATRFRVPEKVLSTAVTGKSWSCLQSHTSTSNMCKHEQITKQLVPIFCVWNTQKFSRLIKLIQFWIYRTWCSYASPQNWISIKTFTKWIHWLVFAKEYSPERPAQFGSYSAFGPSPVASLRSVAGGFRTWLTD